MQNTPKQTKLLGAKVRGVGVVVAVSSTLTYGYAIIEGTDKVNRLLRLSTMKHDDVIFPGEPQPYVTQTERVAYGVWDEVHSLIPAQSLLEVAA